ncbi:hypothetical protein [Ochrobactrum sp. CGA5]|nr:hypothetical protein [Ochrobactrum sp. CGA5]
MIVDVMIENLLPDQVRNAYSDVGGFVAPANLNSWKAGAMKSTVH